ncbi:MAG: trifunctional histidinol dehydrogenase [Cirrosporium novae-zelandiae]|nr:MAG: trifunctional histidinol dehydrogenase [Cirrosporium novae-zelandiae]
MDANAVCKGIGLPFLVTIDLSTNFTNQSNGLQLKQISYLSQVYASVSPKTVQNAYKLLDTCINEYGPRFQVFLNVTNLADALDDVETFLELGCSRIIVTFAQLKELVSRNENIPSSRFVVSVDGHNAKEPAKEVENTQGNINSIFGGKTTIGGLHIYNPGNFVNSAFKAYGFSGTPDIESARNGREIVLDLESKNMLPLWGANELTTKEVSKLLLGSHGQDRTSPLYPTMVVNEHGVGLGLVYSTPESIDLALSTGTGVYYSRSRNEIWRKGATSGDTQELISINSNCNSDSLRFVVRQNGRGFCHTPEDTCYGSFHGLYKLQDTLKSRMTSAPKGSYTARLFNDPELLNAKIKEEATELCEAKSKKDVAFEAADVLYFALVKCIASGVNLQDIENNLDFKHLKCKRRPGNAKPQYIRKDNTEANPPKPAEISSDPKPIEPQDIKMQRYVVANEAPQTIQKVLQRPAQGMGDLIMSRVTPIIKGVREEGDSALLRYINQLDVRCPDPINNPVLKTPVLAAPFPENLMQIAPETKAAIDVSFNNIKTFHAAQATPDMHVDTMPGVTCSRFSRPIQSVGLYIPGGTAVLPSTTLMLGVPAMVAGCPSIVLATPPRSDGSVSPEIIYIASLVGASHIVLAGGAQAVAAMAYGTASVPKVDKILGPGNQYVTAAKMVVSNDTSAAVSIDMPAGPSEVLVIADSSSNPAFVAADLLSQAEHGVDSQVILIAIALSETQLEAIEKEVQTQAMALPRVDIVRGSIAHSVTLVVKDVEEALKLSNFYAPEHLILQLHDPHAAVPLVNNAGSVFVGPWTPESVGDYSAGVNHSLPTYGYAKQYSGVNLGSFQKQITASCLTEHGLRNVGTSVMQLAKIEELEAHRRAVEIRLQGGADGPRL